MKNLIHSVKWIILSVFLFIVSASCRQPGKDDSQSKMPIHPNVLFIIVDDLNDYPGPFKGHPLVKTPNIDKLAAAGVKFINAHSNYPVCCPSRNSLFTGVYPHVSKDFGWTKHWEQPVLKNNKTLFEYFRENGYYVMGSGKLLHHNRKQYWDEWGVDINNYGPFAFNGKKVVGHPSVPEPFRSIGVLDGSFAPLSDVPTFPDSISGGNETGWVYSQDGKRFLHYIDDDHRDLMPDEMHAQWAVKRIREMDSVPLEKPFFMGVGFVRPHTPLYAPKKYYDMFPLDKLVLNPILQGDIEDTHYQEVYPPSSKGLRAFRAIKAAYGGDAELGLKHFLQGYLACIAFVDDQIGKVVDALNHSRFKDNTIIIFTSDHGWQMGEKDYLFKNSPWEKSTRIPLIIKTPFTKPGGVVDHPVSLIDLYPTLKDLCGLKGDNRRNNGGGPLGGYSLKPFLENPETKKWKGPDGSLTVVGIGKRSKEVLQQTWSLRTKEWRYVMYLDSMEELYNEKKDPYEWHNLANDKKYAKKKETLRKELYRMLHH